MKCTWNQIEHLGSKRIVRCQRCQLTLKVPLTSGDNIQSECNGWPLPHEWRHWVSFALAVLGLSEQRWNLIKIARSLVKPDVSGLGAGPGTEMALILASLGASDIGTGCGGRAKQMNDWGADGCAEHRAEIVGWLNEGTANYGRFEKTLAAILAVKTGVIFRLRWSDPLGCIVDESVRRAKLKELRISSHRNSDGASIAG